MGANAYYCEDHIDWDELNMDILHIGYILLLPALDTTDAEYVIKMVRLIHRARKQGMKSSIDVVSETGERLLQRV